MEEGLVLGQQQIIAFHMFVCRRSYVGRSSGHDFPHLYRLGIATLSAWEMVGMSLFQIRLDYDYFYMDLCII